MNRESYHIELISPCFCAGADQSKAEIRAPSIRGQLRWWFRVLGGTPRDESVIFGTVAGDEDCASSALIVRIADFRSGPVWKPPTINQYTPENYVWHYASVSGKAPAAATGPRWKSTGAVSPQSTFTLHLVWRKTVTPAQKSLFNQSLQAFLVLGALGLRATRGLGAFVCKEARSIEEQQPGLEKVGIVFRRRTAPDTFSTYESTLRDYSSWFRYELRDSRKGKKHDCPSPLGGTTPERQASAIRFRPIKLDSGQFTWLAYEAPHQRVLGPKARTSPPMLESYQFTGPAPSAPETRRKY